MKLSTKVSLLCSARFKALQSAERLHNNDLTFPSEGWWVHVCVYVWVKKGKEKKKKDWQGKSNYFEGLSIIHEKIVFQRPPERCTRVKDLSSLPILHSSYKHNENQATPWQATGSIFNTDWCKCSSSHAYEPFMHSAAGTKRRWHPGKAWSQMLAEN